MKKKVKKLSSLSYEIIDRFVTDYLLSERLHFETLVRIDTTQFPFSIFLNTPVKKRKEAIFGEIFSRILNSDKKLSKLLKRVKIENLNPNYK